MFSFEKCRTCKNDVTAIHLQLDSQVLPSTRTELGTSPRTPLERELQVPGHLAPKHLGRQLRHNHSARVTLVTVHVGVTMLSRGPCPIPPGVHYCLTESQSQARDTHCIQPSRLFSRSVLRPLSFLPSLPSFSLPSFLGADNLETCRLAVLQTLSRVDMSPDPHD